ncbi:MAG: exodeoxyribonuclease V subunit gamma [Verrucomicrobia bacterium]|nr:exodeoxyribonuclease V subunit gamma [Verrucomicrobiota bacterium]
MKLFFSNSIDVLAGSLRDILFRAGLPPLTRRTVIVPSDLVKHSLQMRWAHDPELSAVCAVRFLQMPQALSEFFVGLPCAMELSLKIENCLLTIEDPELKDFLVDISGPRYQSLCDHLAELFLRYFAYEVKLEGWQKELWEKVWPAVIEKPAVDPLFLFHPSYLPPRFKKFFEKQAAALFALSPSKHYWGDVLSPKEQLFLPHLEDYFQAQHPLLTHFGKVAREFEKSFSEPASARYVAPKKKSLLAEVQKSLLHLTSLPQEPQGGIEVHAATSKRREVEIVLERISQLKIPEQEILVLAPDIAQYAAHIHMVFAGRCDYAIEGLPLDMGSSVVAGLRALLHIVEHKFAPTSIASLLSCTPFLQKFGLEEEEVEKIVSWTKEIRLLWPDFFREALSGIFDIEESPLHMEDLELLSKWQSITALLEKHLRPLIDNTSQTVSQWMVFLQEMVSTFFFIEREDEPVLAYLRQAAKWEAGLLSWTSMDRVLKSMLTRKAGDFQTSHLSAVRFASIGPILPPSVVFVMGMEEGSFPRKERKSSLALMGASFRPSKSDEDRHFLLQLLLTAKDKIIFTYGSVDADDGKEVPPSTPLAELLKMLPQISITKHVPRAAPPKRAKRDLPVSLPAEDLTIDIRHLKLLARHPIEFYLQRTLGIYFDKTLPSLVSFFDLAKARKDSLHTNISDIVQHMQRRGKLPLPPFQEVSARKVTEEVEEFQKMLKTWGIEEIFSVDLREGCDEVIKKSGDWIIPALEIGNVKIVGKISDVSKEGLLFSGSHTYPDLLKAWPLLLILHHLPLDIPKQILFTKDGSKVAPAVADPSSALRKYLDYYIQALQKPSPLLPSIAQRILGGEDPKLPEDPVSDWFLDHFAEPAIDEWRPLLREVMHDEI